MAVTLLFGRKTIAGLQVRGDDNVAADEFWVQTPSLLAKIKVAEKSVSVVEVLHEPAP